MLKRVQPLRMGSWSLSINHTGTAGCLHLFENGNKRASGGRAHWSISAKTGSEWLSANCAIAASVYSPLYGVTGSSKDLSSTTAGAAFACGAEQPSNAWEPSQEVWLAALSSVPSKGIVVPHTLRSGDMWTSTYRIHLHTTYHNICIYSEKVAV